MQYSGYRIKQPSRFGEAPAPKAEPEPPEGFDDITAKHIAETSEVLKNQLDNILLFAALFSAINSAFLVYTLPVISSSAEDTTNALLLYIIQGINNESFDAASRLLASAEGNGLKVSLAINQMFAVSLILSIIVTLGAVLGQTWVTTFGRIARGAAKELLEERQRKILGAERWYFRAVVEILLPIMLQLALVVFCIGFVVLLWSINPGLAISVLPFLALGFAGVATSAVFALWDPDCPFQTPLSSTLMPRLLSGVYWVWYHLTTLSHHTEPDVYERNKHQLVRYLQRKPNGGKISASIEAACWFVENAREESAVRQAASSFLLLQDRTQVTHVSTQQILRRLRKEIRLTDDDLHEEELQIAQPEQDPLELEEDEWIRLSFYVHVLSHIFAGMENYDPAWYDWMDKIYLYQTMRARKDSHKHTHTIVPARMVGVIKLLLSEDNGIRIHAIDPDRNTVLRDRLYACVAESGCSPKALSLAAFAMQQLPQVCTGAGRPPKPAALASGSRGTSATLRIRSVSGGWILDERSRSTSSTARTGATATLPSPEFEGIHDELWRLYIHNDLDEVCRNVVGAMQTYTQRHASQYPSPALPSREQFLAFLQRVGEHVKVHKPTKTSPTYRKFFVEACMGLLRSLKASQVDEQSDGYQLYQETHSLLRLSIDHVTEDTTAYDTQELIVVSEWCPQLVKLHLDIQEDGEILHRAGDVMRICHTALNERDKNHVKELGRAFVPLVVATGQLLMANGPVHPEAGPEREAFIAEGVGLISAMTEVLFPGQLGSATSLRIAFASQEAVTAMHHFMEVSKSNRTQLTIHQSQFMQQYGRLLREVKAVRWMSLGDRRRELLEEIKLRIGEDSSFELGGRVILGGNGDRASPAMMRPPREWDAFR